MAEYKLWKLGEEVLCAPFLAMDTETHPIVDHTIPDVVIMQVYDGNKVQLVYWKDIPAYLKECSVWNAKTIFIFHNVAFDIAVLGYPDFLIRAADEGRIIDTMFRYCLFKLEKDGFLKQRSLKVACKDILDRDIEKDDDVRCTFDRNVPLDKAHLDYAADDPVHTYDLAMGIDPQPTEDIQVRGAIALDYISRLGMRVDEDERSRLEVKLTDELAGHMQVLEDNGYIPGVKGNSGVLQEYLKRIEERYDLDLARTPTGKIQTSDAAIESIGNVLSYDRFINSFKKQSHLNKMIKTYLKTDVIGKDGRVHTRFNPLLNTGRTSSSNPNLFRSLFRKVA